MLCANRIVCGAVTYTETSIGISFGIQIVAVPKKMPANQMRRPLDAVSHIDCVACVFVIFVLVNASFQVVAHCVEQNSIVCHIAEPTKYAR